MGRGNGFLAMLMVGVSLEIHLKREDLGEVLQMLLVRYACAAVSFVFIFYLIPALVMRQVLALAVFAAAPNVAMIYTNRLGVRTEIAAAMHPLSTAFMIPLMSAMMLLVR